jgi:hypothetical protein
MHMKPPTLPLNYAPMPSRDDLLLTLRLIQHATAPTPDDGGHHEAAHDLASEILKRVDAHVAYIEDCDRKAKDGGTHLED